ncbi:heavy metal translocating P-type ATPase [Mastigocoleus sp. MO_188.B34]|uniref:heavy metal translocating P-type ATPase n=1 Tax=Mastigocoleus sp. MO_188.B34 TaxID=3036635 RepID=UPI002625C213|nr:heavy metal translocating P-type ATPase [Mastigocoleus sp. MO_188.B34]MDJ0696397.1 heavy metal translocating P-type ATPase [Mastigocoleus sp. MO_188.B34]
MTNPPSVIDRQQIEAYHSLPCLVHHVPGRVRFRIYRLKDDLDYAANLKQFLLAQPRINHVRVNRAAASITIDYLYLYTGSSLVEIASDLANLIKQAATTSSIPNKPSKKPTLTTENWSSLRLPVFTTIVSWLSYQSGLVWLRSVALASLVTVTLPIAKRAIQSLFGDRKINIDCLDLLALGLSYSQGRLVTPALVITLHQLGDLIRDRTARSTATQTADLMDAIGHFAWVLREGQLLQIKSDSVQPGETVIVYPGEQIPVDGEVLKGRATIDQQQLTGESVPIVAEAGTVVYASTLVRSGQIYIRTDRVGKNTRAAASIELLQNAPVQDTRMANYAAQVADKLILPSLVLAVIVLAITKEPARAASILTLDFVTGIRISIPTAFLSALNHNTRHGILVRSGRSIEQLAEVDTVVFDKTGTLTQGTLSVVGIQTIPGRMSAEQVLTFAAAAEQRIAHPVAEVITNYAQSQNINIPLRQKWNYEVGLGIRATVESQEILVGSDRFLAQEGIDLECLGTQAFPLHHTCDIEQKSATSAWLSLIYVACDGKLQGVIQYADPLRSESHGLIQYLQASGRDIHLLTGDNQKRANVVAEELNIPLSQVHAQAFPEQKAAILRDLKLAGKTVAFVGDGLNDSVALAYADVSISFASGSDIAREIADVVLMNNDLASLMEALNISQETKQLIEQNTLLVVAPNLMALGMASTLGLNPLVATIVHNGSAIAAGLNSLRPLVQHNLEEQNSLFV